MTNALRYTRRGGVLLGGARPQRRSRIVVSDTGPGIAPRRREAIFEEFQREGGPGDGGQMRSECMKKAREDLQGVVEDLKEYAGEVREPLRFVSITEI